MSISGIIIVDKPPEWTSHDVVAKLRGVFKIKRIGHGGTLDPMATGVLPIFVGRATRAAEFCENAEKEYIAGLRPGVVTDTQDITGSILSSISVSVNESDLSVLLQHFLGEQKQIPPMYSAIKQDGKKLYELARRGIDVPRQARDIRISVLELLKRDGQDFLLRVVCSKGTYIRTLCHDIGTALGCGATMSSLRRTRAGAFTIGMAHDLSEIISSATTGNAAETLMPVDSIFAEYPSVRLSDADTRRSKNGALNRVRDHVDGTYRFYGPDDEFLALCDVKNGEVKTIKNFFEVQHI